MSSFCVRVRTPVDPATAYRFVADGYADNHPRWDDDVVAVHLDGPVRPGVRGSEVRRFLGRDRTTRFEVLAADPPRRLVLRDDPAVWELTRTYEFAPDDTGGTRLSLDFAMTPRSALFRLAYRLGVGRLIRGQVQSTVHHLGRVLAESHGRRPPASRDGDRGAEARDG